MSHELVPVVFGNTFESLLSGLRERIDPETEKKLASLGIDVKRIGAAYPVDQFQRALQVLAESAFPSLMTDEAMFEVGRAYVHGMASTAVGSALYALARVIGPRRMLERMTRNARTSNNFVETSLEEQPDGTLVLVSTLREELREQMAGYEYSPHYFRGIVHEALVQTGAKDPQVTIDGAGSQLATRYRITFAK